MNRALRHTIVAGALALGLLGATAGTAQALAQTGTSTTSNAASQAKKMRVVLHGTYDYNRCHALGREKLQQGAYHYSCVHEGGTYGWRLRSYWD